MKKKTSNNNKIMKINTNCQCAIGVFLFSFFFPFIIIFEGVRLSITYWENYVNANTTRRKIIQTNLNFIEMNYYYLFACSEYSLCLIGSAMQFNSLAQFEFWLLLLLITIIRLFIIYHVIQIRHRKEWRGSNCIGNRKYKKINMRTVIIC